MISDSADEYKQVMLFKKTLKGSADIPKLLSRANSVIIFFNIKGGGGGGGVRIHLLPLLV